MLLQEVSVVTTSDLANVLTRYFQGQKTCIHHDRDYVDWPWQQSECVETPNVGLTSKKANQQAHKNLLGRINQPIVSVLHLAIS
jgi:hypothetical protein